LFLALSGPLDSFTREVAKAIQLASNGGYNSMGNVSASTPNLLYIVCHQMLANMTSTAFEIK
jgi:hypothetical protein